MAKREQDKDAVTPETGESQAPNFGIPAPADTEEARREAEARSAERRVEESDAETNRRGHVKMHKDGKDIHVHSSTVADHEKQGWKLVA